MLKQFGVIVLLFLFCIMGCASGPQPHKTTAEAEVLPFLLSIPTGQGLTFIGVAGKRSDPKETIRLALEDAARRVAIFHKVSGEYLSETNIGSGTFDYAHDVQTSLNYDEEGSARYVDALQFDADTDTMEIENVLIIRAAYQSALPVPVRYHPVYSGSDTKPDWVDFPPPAIEGYEIGIGYAGRHSSLADTYAAAYQNAIFSIIRNIHITSQAGNFNYQGAGTFDYNSASEDAIYAHGSLVHFYVLDTWIDPQSKAVWTLAVAEKDKI
ncbi:hypothetical protein FACS189485_00660 [Spirochaetia bacterium]|nr:hypothetical protein FACS189485_00660 [Spirochaetia bacterium]